ncbi:hypothetical protein JTZ10_23175 [Gordonia rubripertincta]|jgi:hypothetical protein|uniref:Uncharacterized protein n=1 Tax=Gordonia rubripertincta TaxID=36822 RepID=A0AAW4GBQ2_GORRU|nr:hypothetical protein [Gordonia rubripertincta]MBM7280644.1 hypothetical protein [Gordonia rubripertincta]QMU23453.1 hypothetical protein H3V45_24075 [Gordonia rubripertincta]
MGLNIEDPVQEFRDSAFHWRKDWDGLWHGVDDTPGLPPGHWTTAVQLLSQDLDAGLLTDVVDLRGSSWHIFISPSGQALIELHVIRDSKETGFVSNDELLEADCTENEAIYWAAETVHGDLTGYHHILWPEIDGRLFEPSVRDGQPCWADRAGKDTRVFPIGHLDAATSTNAG